MFETYMHVSAISAVVMAAIAILILPPLLLIQYYVYKKILDPIYFNNKHFSEGELVIMNTGIIFYIHKSIIYLRAITFPKTMRIRFKEDILTFKHHPFVYLLAWLTMLLIICGAAILINLTLFLFIWEYRS